MEDDLYRHLTELPARGTPAADLTDRDKVALALAVGVGTAASVVGNILSLRTLNPIGVADRGDGGWIVAVGPRTP